MTGRATTGRAGAGVGGQPEPGNDFTELAERCWAAFSEALDDDLNGPRALAALFQMANEGNALLDRGVAPSERALEVWRTMDSVLDVLPAATRRLEVGGDAVLTAELSEAPPAESAAAEAWAAAWAARRRAAKAEKNWPEADRIRDLLAASGWQIRDRRDGVAEVVRA